MAVMVSTNNPAALWRLVQEKIGDGSIKTWDLIKGTYLTHNPAQWNRNAFFRVLIQEEQLNFFIVPPEGQKISTEDYAVYHGRLIEMLLAHFDRRFRRASASANPVPGDSVG